MKYEVVYRRTSGVGIIIDSEALPETAPMYSRVGTYSGKVDTRPQGSIQYMRHDCSNVWRPHDMGLRILV